MTRECVAVLCIIIIASVGENTFKYEYYIDSFLVNEDRVHMAHEKTCGEHIPVKNIVVVTLRLLTGGESCGLGVLFDIISKHYNNIMISALRKWINKN